MIFAIYHADLPAKRRHDLREISVSFRAPHDPHALLALLFRSVALFHPRARKCVLSDSQTAFDLPVDVEIVRFDAKSDSPILNRMIAQTEFLRAHGTGDPIVFLDFDILVTRPLDSVFADDFDVGLTHRSHATMPLNGGVFFIGPHRAPRVAAFLEELHALHERICPGKDWYGDQLALQQLVGDRPAGTDTARCGETQVRFFDCETHNFTPQNAAQVLRGQTGQFLWHFKGTHKAQMKPYFDLHIAPPLEKRGETGSPAWEKLSSRAQLWKWRLLGK